MSRRSVLEKMAAQWDGSAADLERQARSPEFKPRERELLELRARERRACAQELRIEASKVTNDR